jgi:hypothetical protein
MPPKQSLLEEIAENRENENDGITPCARSWVLACFRAQWPILKTAMA